MSELDDLISKKELLHKAEIQILRQIAEKNKDQYMWVFDKPVHVMDDPLYGHKIHRVDRDENGNIEKIVLIRNNKFWGLST